MFTSNKDEFRSKHVEILNKEFENESLSRNVEKYLYNATIAVAKEKCMIRRWDNVIFKELYFTKHSKHQINNLTSFFYFQYL